jgi:phenylalanyl-tRNA synthetase beta chain
VQRALRQAAGKRLVSIELFDIYRGAALPEDTRSLAFRLRLQEVNGTLTDAILASVQQDCVAAVEKVGGKLRG